MFANTYTEDEFKKILKSLFAEKKKVRELQKQLEERGLQKRFQAKVEDIHKYSVEDEYTELKETYYEKEKECQFLKQQLEKVKPVLKKLIADLRLAQEELQNLKEASSQKEQAIQNQLENELLQVKEKLKESVLRISEIEEKNRYLEENAQLSQDSEIVFLEEKIRELEQILEEREETIALMEREKEILEKALQASKHELNCKEEEIILAHQKEAMRFESDRGRFVERLAENLSQTQRQTEIIRDLKDEIALLKREIEFKEEQSQKSDTQVVELKERLRKASEEAHRVHSVEVNQKIEAELMSVKEEMGHIKLQWEERDEEVHKAQQHLAKKIKETTLLRDLVEQQKIQIIDLNASLAKQQKEYEHLSSTFSNLKHVLGSSLENLNQEDYKQSKSSGM